jgi:signal transduction histidine kinase
MFDIIIEAFKAQMPSMIIAVVVYAFSVISVFLISTTVNVFELKQSFDLKRFVNGIAEIIMSAISVFTYVFTVVGFIQLIDLTGILQDGKAQEATVLALVAIIGVAIYKNIIKYQEKAKEKLEVSEEDLTPPVDQV